MKIWTLKEFNCPPFVHFACKHFDDGFDNNTYMHIDIITLKQGQELYLTIWLATTFAYLLALLPILIFWFN